jgi:integrase
MMLTAGESPIWVAQQMGLSDTGMIFKIYGRWIPDAAPDAGGKAVAMFSRAPEKKAAKKLR